tara:strand:+ start:206 stop:586 length:381 start_codon:yes stop_codon:yes gene_type:complete
MYLIKEDMMINGIKPKYPPYMDNKDKYSKAMSLFMGRIDEQYGEYYRKTLTALKYEPIRVNRGRRFDKLIQGGSVYCFVEKNTGNVFKPASWKQPYLKGNNSIRGSIYDTSTYWDKELKYGSWLYV